MLEDRCEILNALLFYWFRFLGSKIRHWNDQKVLSDPEKAHPILWQILSTCLPRALVKGPGPVQQIAWKAQSTTENYSSFAALTIFRFISLVVYTDMRSNTQHSILNLSIHCVPHYWIYFY